jgi:glutathione S-transferase
MTYQEGNLAMKLYYNPISTYSQKALIAFYEKGIDFEPNIVNLMDPEDLAKYRDVYPMGKIPCLVLDDGHLIPESSIIIEYIDSMAEPRLIDGDSEQTRKIRFKDRMIDLYLDDSIVTLLFQGMKPEDQRDPERMKTAKFRIDTMYSFMEAEFEKHPFASGEQFSMADCAAAPALFYAEQAAPFAAYKNVSAYWERLKQRPSVKRTQEEARPALEAFMSKNAA